MSLNLLIIDHSTIKGHHAIYLQGVIQSLKAKSLRLVVCTADNKHFQAIHPNDSISLVELPYTLAIRIISFWLKLFSVKAKNQLILLIQLRNLIRNHGLDFIFFPHLDSVISSDVPAWVYHMINVKWSGIFLKPYAKNKGQKWEQFQRITALKRVKNILMLDEILYDLAPGNHKVIQLPELLFGPEINEQFFLELQKRMENRMGIAMVGSMVRRKRLIDFLNLVDQLDDQKYFVMIAGHFPEDQYSEKEQQLIAEKINSLKQKEMLYHDPKYLVDEAHFNTFYKLAGIIWLNYEDHPFTSNAIIKAINFHTRVISNPDCQYIQRIATRYKHPVLNGPEYSPDDIENLLSKPIDEVQHELFLQHFSFERFSKIIQSAVIPPL